MSELTITLLRLGYLVLLWLFVLTAIAVLRRDLYGTRVVQRRLRVRPTAPRRTPTQPPEAAPAPPPVPAPPAGPRRIAVTGGPLRGTTVPLGSAAVLIGRAPSCTLVLDDDYSSQRHARLYQQGGQWYVEDLGSTNGTFVGRERVTEPTPVGPGTQLRVGQSTLELQR
ncbi:FHA domain-containing protein [Isoptericola sp. b441]|uniref:FHA domain-containing protein n=1 Tax=Actinotalea lenta TaxID=3064654 RepID=A0ABT9D5S1_9CELL|nr:MULTISPECIES: FHA domain-containing protein [unclassified Isoptericola]MDO8106157.1 FHA domain-containing protein [Isoptericola sp. b441]MDO8122124.1 FHA domain-containing protein [Isoptericola sp. b490]